MGKSDSEATRLRENVGPRYSFESGRSAVGEFETDARFVHLQVNTESVQYSLIEPTRLNFGDWPLFPPPQILMRQDDGTYLRTSHVRWRAREDDVKR